MAYKLTTTHIIRSTVDDANDTSVIGTGRKIHVLGPRKQSDVLREAGAATDTPNSHTAKDKLAEASGKRKQTAKVDPLKRLLRGSTRAPFSFAYARES